MLRNFVERLLSRWSPVKPTINTQLVEWHRFNRRCYVPNDMNLIRQPMVPGVKQ